MQHLLLCCLMSAKVCDIYSSLWRPRMVVVLCTGSVASEERMAKLTTSILVGSRSFSEWQSELKPP